MSVDAGKDPRFLELAESLGLFFEVGDVALVVATVEDQALFVPWMAGQINGTIVGTASPYPCSAFLETLDEFDYLFLVIQEDFPDDLYLMVRDYALDRNAELNTRFGRYSIHPQHRLAVFMTSTAMNELPVDLRRVLTTICQMQAFSSDPKRPASAQESQPTHEGYQVFANIDSAIAWSERYYRGGRFLFRGQAEDWRLRAPLQRYSTDEEALQASRRTEAFIEWLMEQPEAKEIGDNIELAKAAAQHFGLPTDFLDLSRTPQVAGFFAAHKPPPDRDKLGVLYVFSEAELERHLSFDEEGAKRFGKGLVGAEIKSLRRIRHQQGLFIQSQPTLMNDFMLTKLFFHHRPLGTPFTETTFLPREFIFPPPSSFERTIYTYLLVETATGGRGGKVTNMVRPPSLSFDSGGYVARPYLDDSPLGGDLAIHSLFTILDSYAGLLCLTASHLFVHNAIYTFRISEFLTKMVNAQLTREFFGVWRDSYYAIVHHLNQAVSTGIPEVPELSIRDLVDGLALYHDIRSGNPDFEPAALEHALGTFGARVLRAYRCADHWLGDEAFEMFPIAASFALSCEQPVEAFLEAVRQIGRNQGSFLVDRPRRTTEQYLGKWTGYETVSVDDLLSQLPVNPLLEKRYERLKALREEKPDEVELLGSKIFRIQSADTIQELSAQFSKRTGGQIAILKYDQDEAALFQSIELARSVAEGITGMETTMLCDQTECPFHRFRICGRVSRIPPTYQECQFKLIIERDYSLSVDHLTALMQV